MRGIAAAQLWTASFWGAYTIAAATAIIWSALLVVHGHDSLLATMFSRPWVALCAYAPIIIGLIVQLAGRRFWAWPYVYLLVLVLAITGTTGDIGDQMYTYGGSVVWVVTVLVAESVGLTLGRWLHRFIGIAFFLGAGAWMLVEGFRLQQNDLADRWQVQTLILSGGLFIIHAAVQLANYRRAQRSAPLVQPEDEPQEPLPSPPEPAVGANQQPWIIQSEEIDGESPDVQDGAGDNTKSE